MRSGVTNAMRLRNVTLQSFGVAVWQSLLIRRRGTLPRRPALCKQRFDSLFLARLRRARLLLGSLALPRWRRLRLCWQC